MYRMNSLQLTALNDTTLPGDYQSRTKFQNTYVQITKAETFKIIKMKRADNK